MKTEKKRKRFNSILIILIIMLMVTFLMVGLVIAMVLSAKQSGDIGKENTEEIVVDINHSYALENEEMYLKYGNFKDYESAIAVIRNSMPDAGEQEIADEIFRYWFTLLRYGDYKDAYTFVSTDKISEAGIDYSIEDFTEDMTELRVCGGIDDPLQMEVTVMEGATPSEAGYGMLHMAVITSIEEKDAGIALFLPFYMLGDNRIIPFDLLAEAPAERYGTISNDSPVNASKETETTSMPVEDTEIQMPEDTLEAQ